MVISKDQKEGGIRGWVNLRNRDQMIIQGLKITKDLRLLPELKRYNRDHHKKLIVQVFKMEGSESLYLLKVLFLIKLKWLESKYFP
jgi:hypothetical protein